MEFLVTSTRYFAMAAQAGFALSVAKHLAASAARHEGEAL
jgi:hypothetical protein